VSLIRTMSGGGLRRVVLVAAVLIGAFGIGAAGCSSGPSAAAKGLCGSIPGTPPPPNFSVALLTQPIKAGEHSGNQVLEREAGKLLRAMNDHSGSEITAVESQIVATCTSLGIPNGTFGTTGG
jgi:hypothetical protein